MKIEIKHRITNEIKISGEFNSVKEACEENKANLREADLREADLRGADLRGADLYGADLYEANLREANLYGADLYGANLRGVDLYGAKIKIQPIAISSLEYFIIITEEHIKIGCQVHTHNQWSKFSDKLIEKMDCGALEWWDQYKPMIMAIADNQKRLAKENK